MLSILQLFPELLDLNGDAQNALVLRQRSLWAGHAAEIVPLALGDAASASAPGIVVVGSGAESANERVRDALVTIAPRLAEWVAAGIPLLAVGTGMELLSEGVDLDDGSSLDGIGVLPGRAIRGSIRVSDDIVVESEFGRLIGFENHTRGLALPDGTRALGRVIHGRGNAVVAGAASEGVRVGNAIGTHLHGPLLAKNPAVADFLLGEALGAGYDSRNVPAGRVDDMARAARNQIAARLGLDRE